MKKKVTALCLVGASLAYFTDTKSATNTFTVGNVKIDLIESRFHREGNDNSGDTSIPDPTQTASGMKYVTDGHKAFTDDEIKADAEKYSEYIGERGKNMVPGRNFLVGSEMCIRDRLCSALPPRVPVSSSTEQTGRTGLSLKRTATPMRMA